MPDLIVEVLSPADNPRDVASKVGEYRSCGVPLVWVVDPERRTVTVHRPDEESVEHGATAGRPSFAHQPEYRTQSLLS